MTTRIKFIFLGCLVAAICATSAYAISTVNGQLSTVQCVTLTTVAGCSQASGIDEPVAIAKSSDETKIFAASRTSDAVTIFYRNGGILTQPGNGKGCISETGGGICADGRALDGASDVVNRDNEAWVASSVSNAVTTIKANNGLSDYYEPSATGACTSEDGTGGACNVGRGLTGADAIAIRTVKWDTVYVGGVNSIAVFRRQAGSGLLTQLAGTDGCVNNDGSEGCIHAFVPDTVKDLLVSTNGKYLYAATAGAGNGAVLVFTIDENTGALTQMASPAGCITDDGTGGFCTDANTMVNPTSIATDFDNAGGISLYAAASGSDAVDIFLRNEKTGVLTQRPGTGGCVSATGSLGACTIGKALTGVTRVNVYKTNKYVEVGAGDGVASFNRDKHTAALSQMSGTAGCVTVTGNGGQCTISAHLGGVSAMLSTGGGKNLYVTGTTEGSITVLRIK